MNKIKTFIHIFKNSLFPEKPYYSKVYKAPLSLSLKYYGFLFLITFLICSSIIAYREISTYNFFRQIRTDLKKSLDRYPNDMRIFLENKQMTSTEQRPLFLYITKNNAPYPYIVIDQLANPDDINKYDAKLLVGQTGITVAFKNGKKHFIYPGTGRHVITKKFLLSYFDHISPVLKFAPLVGFFYFFFSSLISSFVIFLQRSLLLLLLSLILLAMVSILRKKIRYLGVFSLVIHSATLPILTEAVLFTIVFNYKPHYLASLLYIIFASTAVYQTLISGRKSF